MGTHLQAESMGTHLQAESMETHLQAESIGTHFQACGLGVHLQAEGLSPISHFATSAILPCQHYHVKGFATSTNDLADIHAFPHAPRHTYNPYDTTACTMSIYEKVMTALSRSQPPFRTLHLRDNYIGIKGAKSMAEMLRSGVLRKLERLDLQNNPRDKEKAWNIVLAYLENPLLTMRVCLDWLPDLPFKLRASTFREENILLEHKLKSMQGVKVQHGGILKDYKWRPHFSLEQKLSSGSKPFSLHLLCQNCNERKSSFQRSKIHTKFLRQPSGKIVDTDPPQGLTNLGTSYDTAVPGATFGKIVDTDPPQGLTNLGTSYDTVGDAPRSNEESSKI
ncbi:hypothetical protein R1sor_014029 [Riccia sorocarpa]|uniref:Uncharacterized protein n=1 Tax=Riccia sorocarpa TaxID=122646 RepID=A0ABD3H890_9MARC